MSETILSDERLHEMITALDYTPESERDPADVAIAELLGEVGRLKGKILARDYWARDVSMYHEMPYEGEDLFATIAIYLKRLKTENSAERLALEGIAADLKCEAEWGAIGYALAGVMVKPRELADKWRSQAAAAREESVRIRKTIKAPTDAEERCIVRAEVWEKCAEEVGALPTISDEEWADAKAVREGTDPAPRNEKAWQYEGDRSDA